ncbi:anthranilate synthase component I, partial [Candidatus Bathyarchaeota archaeon]|nr:anthranilate synthase component I [Candidatus Bathyarchaeota archaeon]
ISNDRFRLIGGAVGYISYDSIRYWETLPNAAIDDLNLPDVEMGIYDDGIVFDHTEKRAYYYSSNASRFDEVEYLREPLMDKNDGLRFSEPKLNVCKEDFEESGKKAKKYVF